MSFKDEYGKIQRQITPDKEFLERLAENMENEKNRNKGNKTRIRAAVISVSAAVAAIAAALTVIVNRPQSTPPHPETVSYPDVIGVGADKINRIEGLFSEFEVSEGTVSPNELAEILRSNGTTVYSSEIPTFDFDDKMEADKIAALAESVSKARENSIAPEGTTQNTQYYMAVAEDGKIVKFSVTGSVLEIN